MGIISDFLVQVKTLLRGQRPAAPACPKCGDEMLLQLEVEQGACTDCMRPTYARTPRIKDRIGRTS